MDRMTRPRAMSQTERLLHTMLTNVAAELDRVRPGNPTAARAKGVLEAVRIVEVTEQPKKKPRKRVFKSRRILPDWGMDARLEYEAGASLLDVANKHDVAVTTARDVIEMAGGQIRPRGIRHKGMSPENAERVERMKALWEGGTTMEVIAATEHITRERVRQLLNKGGVNTSERKLDAHQRAAVQAYVDGGTLYGVAARFQTNEQTLRNWILRAGYELRPANKLSRRRDQTWARADKAARLYKEGVLTIEEIANAVGLKTGSQIYRLLALKGIKADRRPHELDQVRKHEEE